METVTPTAAGPRSTAVGDNAFIIKSLNRHVTVSGFSNALGKLKRIPIVQACVIYDDKYSGGIQRHLVINNAFHIKGMKVNLIPPMMMRMAGLHVYECPKFLVIGEPSEEHHTIYFPDEELRVPLLLEKVVSYIPTRRPDDGDMLGNLPNALHLTPDVDDWDPNDPSRANQESAMIDWKGETAIRKRKDDQNIFELNTTSEVSTALSVLDEGSFGFTVMKKYFISALTIRNRKYFTTVADLSKVFNCSREVARRTLERTTQRCSRATSLGLSRRYSTNDRMLRYPRLRRNMFMDTLFTSVKSTRGYKCAQLLVSDYGCIGILPWRVERISTLRSSRFSRIEAYPLSLSAIELQNK